MLHWSSSISQKKIILFWDHFELLSFVLCQLIEIMEQQRIDFSPLSKANVWLSQSRDSHPHEPHIRNTHRWIDINGNELRINFKHFPNHVASPSHMHEELRLSARRAYVIENNKTFIMSFCTLASQLHADRIVKSDENFHESSFTTIHV